MTNLLDRPGTAPNSHHRNDRRMDQLPAGPAPSVAHSLLGGLAAGSFAGFVAALVQLPLHSPDDVIFNGLTVVLAALAAGVAAGALWHTMQKKRSPRRMFAALLAASFLVIAIGTFGVDRLPHALLAGLPGFVIPLAALVLGGIAILTPLLAKPAWRPAAVGPIAAVAALGLGVALTGHGDARTGELALPSASTAPASGRLLHAADVGGMTFAVSPTDSNVTYTVREKLANLPTSSDAVGKTSQLSGNIFLDGRPSTINIDVSSFQSDQPMRDNFIRTNRNGPQFNQYPQAQLVVNNLTLPREYREGETVKQTVTGTMDIRGVSRPQNFDVQGRLTNGVLELHATTDFTWADYQIPPPNLGNFVQVEDNVHIEALIVAPGTR